MQNGSRRNSRPRQDHRNGGQNSDRFKRQGSQRSDGGGGPANAKRNYERYVALARAAAQAGDAIESENCYQHAEHYFRLMRGQTADNQ